MHQLTDENRIRDKPQHEERTYLTDALFSLGICLSIVTWNAAALFGAMTTSMAQRDRQQQRFSAYLNMAQRYSITCVQEAHGASGDLSTLRRNLPHHMHWGSFCSSPNSGGVITSIQPDFARLFDRWEEVVIMEGRCLAVVGYGKHGNFMVINVHVELENKPALFGKIRKLVPSFDSMVVVLTGDFNFPASDEARYNPSTTKYKYDGTGIAKVFERMFGDLTELHQDDYTRRQMRDDRIDTLSRIDRIFTNIPASILLDLRPITDVLYSVASLQTLSDHVPVRTLLHGRKLGPTQPRIQRWITKHPAFNEYVNELMSKVELSHEAGTAVAEVKEIFHEAASKVKNLSVSRGAQCTQEKLQWSLAAVRALRAKDQRKLKRAIRAYSTLSAWIDSETCESTRQSELHNHIAELANISFKQQHDEIEAMSDVPDGIKNQRHTHISRQEKIFAPMRKQISLTGIQRPDGTVAESTDESVTLLRDHWRPKFTANGVSNEIMEEFKEYIQCVGRDVDWQLSFVEFQEIIESTVDSGLGPDGIPYSAWAKAGDGVQQILYKLYCDLCNYGEIGEDFNTSLMVFLPKGEHADDREGSVSRKGGDTRPLNLSNTDAKIIALAFNKPLSSEAKRTVNSQQRGFVPDRYMNDNILELEAYGLLASLFGKPRPCFALWDFRAAFPSVEHEWIFFVLVAMMLPGFVIHAIKQLYKHCKVVIVFAGMRKEGFNITAGIKQGCPLSGTLFALALDPFMRRLLWQLPASMGILTGFADDLGALLFDLFKSLPWLMHVFYQFASASGLHLNKEKCVLIPLWSISEKNLRNWLAEDVGGFQKCTISNFAKYLGIMIGPDAAGKSWVAPTKKYVERVHAVRNLGLGFCRAVSNYQIHAVSVLQFVAQFEEVPPETLKAEMRSSQLLVAGPWNAIPLDMMHQFKDLGNQVELPCLKHISRAAMYRAAVQSATYWKMDGLLDQALESDDRLGIPKHPQWWESAHIMQLRRNQRALDAISRNPADMMGVSWQRTVVKTPGRRPDTQGKNVQRSMMNRLRTSYEGRSIPDMLQARLKYWCAQPVKDQQLQIVMQNLQIIGKQAPPLLFIASIRTICNAWNTSARFDHQALQCRLCSCDGGDDLRHYCICPTVLRYAREKMPNLTLPWSRPQAPLHGFMLMEQTNSQQILGVAIVHDIILAAINSLRHRQRFAQEDEGMQELHARMKELDKKDCRLHMHIRRLA